MKMFPHPLTDAEQAERNRAIRHLAVQVKAGGMSLSEAAAAAAADPLNHINETDARDLLAKMTRPFPVAKPKGGA